MQFLIPDSASQDSNVLSIDPYAFIEALLGHKVNKPASIGSDSLQSGYDDLDMKIDTRLPRERNMRADSPPKDVAVGAANPYALVEALLGQNIDKISVNSAKIISNVLQIDYDELFNIKHCSVLFAGLKLNEKERKAEKLSEKDMKILNEQDLMTPDLSGVQQLDDLKKIGLKDLGKTRVKVARMQNGKLHLMLHAHSLGKTVSNREVTMSINELSVNKRLIGDLTIFEIGEKRETMRYFDDPTQGCASNSWLIAALFSVFWSDPVIINRATRVHYEKDEKKRLAIKFHDKGGDNNGKTETMEVNYEIPINNSNNGLLYCRSSDGADIWPSLYEKAFAKWITGSSSEQPDITQTHYGDPVKAMAQINGQDPHYYRTENYPANDMLGLVRSNYVNFKTINPMTAWTYATSNIYRGSNVIANHAYSILSYTILSDKQYLILRNPWGVTEPIGLNSYPGLLKRLDPNLWHPASLLDHGGLFAMETEAFKHYFAYIGVTK
ncbi:hypothetical protein FNYG_15592 [Fusarium nygamai]|uniref:Calpain catalytic domain-containing protein n=1 Tax=Gibberella nygamai TaxID=42673 RepID=A0A2K0UAK1_GIBNY|nr:hypothetical protein FNYG_15592 [Fusarium nygamai]